MNSNKLPPGTPMGPGPPVTPGSTMIMQQPIPQSVLDIATQIICIGTITNADGEKEDCKSEIFVDAYRLSYISAFISPHGKETVLNAMIGKMCVKCGKGFNINDWKKHPIEKEEDKQV